MRIANARIFRASRLALLVILVAFNACSDEPFPFDMLPADMRDDNGGDTGPADGQSDDVVSTVQKIRFLTPDPSARQPVSGDYTTVFTYEDSADLPARITVDLVRNSAFKAVTLDVEGAGEYSVDLGFVAALADGTITEGDDSIRVTAVSQDGRKVSAKGKILIDVTPPAIQILEPTPESGGTFTEGLPIRVTVTDLGARVHSVKISIEDYIWEWPSEEGSTAETVDTRTIVSVNSEGIENVEDLTIPTAGWRGGDFVLRIEAGDGIVGHETVVEHKMSFIEPPAFDGGEKLTLSLGPDLYSFGIQGIRIGPAADENWGLLVEQVNRADNEKGSLDVYQRVRYGTGEFVTTVTPRVCNLYTVADMNLDGMDDVVAWCTESRVWWIVVLLQNADMTFTEQARFTTKFNVLDIAVGDLNGDEYPDISFVNEWEIQNTGVIMTSVDENGDFKAWKDPEFLSGAVGPDHVEIGRFSDNGRNAVIVGGLLNGLVTVFPIDENGIPTMGENSSLDPDDQRIKDVSAMIAVNFRSGGDAPDSLVFVDSSDSPRLGLAAVRPDQSSRVESMAEWTTGATPKDIAVGDIDGNGVQDVVVLCGGANMVQVFMGDSGYSDFNYVKSGISLLAGESTDVTLADMDGDGYLDIVLYVNYTDVVVIYYRQDTRGGRFLGSYQAMLGNRPLSLATGHFVKPLTGDGADFLDAAVLIQPNSGNGYIGVYSSDSLTGMPFIPAGNVDLGINTASGILAGNFNVDMSQSFSNTATRPDDLIVTTAEIGSISLPYTARTVLFNEVAHTTVGWSIKQIAAGERPTMATVSDFDPEFGTYRFMDVAFLGHHMGASEVESYWNLQSMVGNMDGTFATQSSEGIVIDALPILNSRNPSAITSFPLRRSLKRYAEGAASGADILVANRSASDFTVFLSLGFGTFQSKDDGSLDFAVGGQPIDLRAGYLRGRVDGTADAAEAENQLPDVVALLKDFVTISYSHDRAVIQASGNDVGYDAPVGLAIAAGNPVAMELVDMNGDGWMDIVLLDRGGSRIQIFMNLGNRVFTEPYKFTTGREPVSMSIRDVDGDGCPDVVTADHRGQTITTLHNDTRACKTAVEE